MAYLPIATYFGAKFTLTGPDGSVATFNDPTDANYVGALTEVSGLDSAEVRESAFDLTESDGATHGSFYLSRRPIVLTGKVFNHTSILERNTRLDRARRASMCLRADGTLAWDVPIAPSGTVTLFVPVRRQQPFRESGAWVKDFQIPLVSQYATIFGNTLKTVATGVATENQGNYPAYPLITITGASTNPTVSDGSRVFRTTGLTLAVGEAVRFDMLNHTGIFTVGARTGQSANRYIDFALTQWPYLNGLNVVQSFSLTGGGTASIQYRDTWA